MKSGIFYIILSGLCFALINFFVKILGHGPEQTIVQGIQKYPAHELVLSRSIISLIISSIVISRKKIPFLGNNKKWLLIRGISGTIALTIFFHTIKILPLAIASIIQYLAPIFTIIFALYFLKQPVKKIQWILILVAFIGVSLIGLDKYTNSAQSSISFMWIGLGMLSAVFSGLAYTSIMKLQKTDAPITIVLYFPLVATPIMLIMCLFEFTNPKGIEWLFLLIIGVFTQLAQVALTRALHAGDAATIAPFQYLGAVYAFLIGYFVFNEKLSLIVNIGISLILIGVFVNAFYKKQNKKLKLEYGKKN